MSRLDNLIEMCESTNAEKDKYKEQAEKIQQDINALGVKMVKEYRAGKSETVLAMMKKQWDQLQVKLHDLWKEYDQKFGTKYAMHYESLEEDYNSHINQHKSKIIAAFKKSLEGIKSGKETYGEYSDRDGILVDAENALSAAINYGFEFSDEEKALKALWPIFQTLAKSMDVSLEEGLDPDFVKNPQLSLVKRNKDAAEKVAKLLSANYTDGGKRAALNKYNQQIVTIIPSMFEAPKLHKNKPDTEEKDNIVLAAEYTFKFSDQADDFAKFLTKETGLVTKKTHSTGVKVILPGYDMFH